jgi:cystathionine gamma-synthase
VNRSEGSDGLRDAATREPETAVVHPVSPPTAINTPVSEPIFQSSAWTFSNLAQAEEVFSGSTVGFAHRSQGSPNHLLLERVMVELEGAQACITTAGGMSALAGVFWTLLEPGVHVVASRDLFGVTVALLADMERWGVTTTFVDTSDASVIADALTDRTRLLITESISNPRMRVPDISSLAELAHRQGARLLVDNTLAGPHHCRPLGLGADIVVESATKALSGHHDVVLGIVAGSHELVDPIREIVDRAGLGPGAFDVWLARRGTVTYVLRQERATANAAQLANWLGQHQAVTAVHYPGRSDHPDHHVASTMLENGYGSMLAFELATDRVGVDVFVAGLKSISLVHSLGGATTSLSHAVTMSHRLVSEERRRELGLHPGFFRMSVGIEALDDLTGELDAALSAGAPTGNDSGRASQRTTPRG